MSIVIRITITTVAGVGHTETGEKVGVKGNISPF